MLVYTLVSCCLVVAVRAGGIDYYSDPPEQEIEAAFKQHLVVPRVLDEAPKKFLFVKYRTKGTTRAVHYVRLGNYLHPLQTDFLPEDVKWEPEEGKYYTLIMIGPNVAASVKGLHEANQLHYAKVNIQGDMWEETGHLIAEHIGPRPYEEYGKLAYTWVLYKQPNIIDFPETYDIDDYPKFDWDLREFLKKHKITELVAGNFFTSDANQEKFSSLLTIEPDDYDTVSPKMLRK